MIEEELNQINPEASSASTNFLKKGWEKLSTKLKENKKIIISGILIGAGATLSVTLAPGLSGILIAGRVLAGVSMGLGGSLMGREIVNLAYKSKTIETTKE